MLSSSVQDLTLFSLEHSGLTEAQIQQLSPAALAYIGDGFYELHVRMQYLMPPKQSRLYHQQVVSQVRAERQAHYLQILDPLLTEEEQRIVKRGRNATKLKPKRLSPSVYQQATGFEALLGYLYLTNLDRLAELLQQLPLGLEERDAAVQISSPPESHSF
jgi:ribonuclease-3 family protein